MRHKRNDRACCFMAFMVDTCCLSADNLPRNRYHFCVVCSADNLNSPCSAFALRKKFLLYSCGIVYGSYHIANTIKLLKLKKYIDAFDFVDYVNDEYVL